MGKHSNNKRIIGIKNCSEKYKKEWKANENNALNRESQLNSHNCLINSKEDNRDLNSYFKRNKVNFRRNNAYSFTVILFICLLLFISNQNTMVFASESSSWHSSTYSCEESYKNLETNSDFIQIKEFYEKSLETMKSQIEELEDNNRDLKAQLQVCNSNQQQMYQGYNPQTHTTQDEQEIDSSKLYKLDDVLDYNCYFRKLLFVI